MVSCEKCWNDAGGNAQRYRDLIVERKDKPCTLEEIAGDPGYICPKCKRNTVHIHVKQCLNCKFVPDTLAFENVKED